MERMFVVIVQRDQKMPLGYQPLNGISSLKLMKRLNARGFNVIAQTNANGIEEQLSLEEMTKIFGETETEVNENALFEFDPSTSEVVDMSDGEVVCTATSVEMAQRIAQALSRQRELETGQKMEIIWSTDDVHAACTMRDVEGLTDELAREVLRRAKRNHDANEGVHWLTLSTIAESVLEEQ